MRPPRFVDREPCLAAYAVAASRTHAPSSCARTRWAIRWVLQGPLPLITSNSSVKSTSPKSWCPRSSFQRISGSGRRQPERLGLRHRHVHEALAQVVVGEALDAPGHRPGGVRRVVVRRAEHHQRRPPVAVHRVLGHRLLGGGAVRERVQDLEALPLVEGLLLADPDHRAGVGTERAAAQRDLVDDGGAVDEPADRPDVGPGQRRVVEDRGVLLAARVQLVEQVGPVHAERLGGGVQVEAVTRLVLHLGHQDRLAAQARGAADPVALGLHADDLGVRVLGDLADQRLAVGLRHLVAGLHPLVAGQQRAERGRLAVGVGGHGARGGLVGGMEVVAVHACHGTSGCYRNQHLRRAVVTRPRGREHWSP